MGLLPLTPAGAWDRRIHGRVPLNKNLGCTAALPLSITLAYFSCPIKFPFSLLLYSLSFIGSIRSRILGIRWRNPVHSVATSKGAWPRWIQTSDPYKHLSSLKYSSSLGKCYCWIYFFFFSGRRYRFLFLIFRFISLNSFRDKNGL